MADVHGRDQVADVGRVEGAPEDAEALTARTYPLRPSGTDCGSGADQGRGDIGHRTRRECPGFRARRWATFALSRWWKSASPGKMTALAIVEEFAMTDSVGQYLNEIGLVPLLTAAEERELSQAVEAGVKARAAIEAGDDTPENRRLARKGAEAKDRFIRANLRLVVSVARRYPLPRPWSSSTSSRRATWASSTPSTSSTGARASSSPPTPRSGSARPSAGPSTRRPRSSGSRATARPASGPPSGRWPATATSSTTRTPASTGSPRPTSLDRTVGDDDGSELIDLIADDKPGPEAMLVPQRGAGARRRPARRPRRPGPLRGRAALRPHRRSQAQLPRGRRDARRHRRGRPTAREAGGDRGP